MEALEHIDILLAEDNPLDAELTMRGLQTDRLFNRIIWVKDGQEALDYIFCNGKYTDRPPSLPGLIMLDLKMPRVDGLEVLATLKATDETRAVPVVIMTSSQEEKDVVASYNLGANSYVVKPVNFDALSEVARQAGYYWLVVNHRAPR